MHKLSDSPEFMVVFKSSNKDKAHLQCSNSALGNSFIDN